MKANKISSRKKFLLIAALAIGVAVILGAISSAGSGQLVQAPRSDGAQTSLRVYKPAAAECAPLALISPGAGGSEDGYRYLAQGLRDDGWQAIVMGHKESGKRALVSYIRQEGIHGGLEKLVLDPAAYEARFRDIAAALQWSEQACKPPFIALLGHSMGARTVMVEAGARNNIGLKGDDRFAAYVTLSPDGPGPMFPGDAWSTIRKPVLILTGTKDKSIDGPWQTRTIPYESLPAGCKWLGVIDGASHMNLAGVGMAGETKKLALLEVTSFLDNLRKGDCGAPRTADGINVKNK